MIRREMVFPVTREELWEALTDPERLEDWFANEVDVDLRPGGAASFRWSNGESRRATVTAVAPGGAPRVCLGGRGRSRVHARRRPDGTRLTVVETAPAWSTALELQASAFRHVR